MAHGLRLSMRCLRCMDSVFTIPLRIQFRIAFDFLALYNTCGGLM